MEVFEFIIALVAVGGTFVTIWVVALSRRGDRRQNRARQEDALDPAALSALAQSMDERITTLEAILDAEVPGWRDHHESAKR